MCYYCLENPIFCTQSAPSLIFDYRVNSWKRHLFWKLFLLPWEPFSIPKICRCSNNLLNVLLQAEGRFISVAIILKPQIEFTELYFCCFFFFSFDPFIKISLNPPTASTQPLSHAGTHTHTLEQDTFPFMLRLYGFIRPVMLIWF